MSNFPSANTNNQSAKFFFFSDTVTGTDFSNTSFANMTERVRLTDVKLSDKSNIEVTGLLNRIQHAVEGIPVFGRIELAAAGFTSQFSVVASVGSSEGYNYKQLNISHLFVDIPAGTYSLEVQLRVNSGTCHLVNDTNGEGTRTLRAIAISV